MRPVLLAVISLWQSLLVCRAAEPKPDIVSPLTLIAETNLIENPKATLGGNVASVWWREFRVARDAAGGSTNVLVRSRFSKYDEGNRAIEEIDRQLAETRTRSSYKDGLLAEQRGRTFTARGQPRGEEFWQTRRYDQEGQLLDLKRGRGQTLENHLTSQYDSSGRLLRREIRQGNSDELVFTEEFAWSGDPPTVVRRILAPGAAPRETDRFRLDTKGNVVELWSQDGYHTRWSFDGQNRATEQVTDPYKNRCDECPLPGAIKTAYNNQEREQTFYGPSGDVELQRITAFEKDGSIAAIRYMQPEAAKSPDSSELNRIVDAIKPIGGEKRVETTWDSTGNWIEKRDLFQPRNGKPVVVFLYRRTISYRIAR